VEGFSALGQQRKAVALHGLGEAVEQAPGRPGRELRVRGLAPLTQHGQSRPAAHDPEVQGADDEVMRVPVNQGVLLVGRNTALLGVPFLDQPGHGTFGDHRQIPQDEAGVLAGELDFAPEGQVVADEDLGTGHDARREGLVVRVTQAHDPSVVDVLLAIADVHEAEVALAVVRQAMGLVDDGEVAGPQGVFDLLDEPQVRDGFPKPTIPSLSV